MTTHLERQITDRMVMLAAAELSSQEHYNPSWCKPGVGSAGVYTDLYRSRARLILEAALTKPIIGEGSHG